jgi:uncharacterized protein (DUF3820 family)
MPLAQLTDDDIMHFGKFKGKRLADVPAYYYFWWWEKPGGPEGWKATHEALHHYIVKNWKRLCNQMRDYDPLHHPPRDTRTATTPPQTPAP